MPRKQVGTIDLSGPFFTKDPDKTFRGNARSMMRRLALEGEADVKARLRAGESGRAPISAGVTPNRVSEHVRSGIPFTPGRSRRGEIKVHVYVLNQGLSPKQARALMAAYSQVERQTHAFRQTTNRLRRARAINTAELLKGLK